MADHLENRSSDANTLAELEGSIIQEEGNVTDQVR